MAVAKLKSYKVMLKNPKRSINNIFTYFESADTLTLDTEIILKLPSRIGDIRCNKIHWTKN